MIELLKKKFKEVSLTLAGLLIVLQFLVGSMMDIVFGLMIVGLLWLAHTWK